MKQFPESTRILNTNCQLNIQLRTFKIRNQPTRLDSKATLNYFISVIFSNNSKSDIEFRTSCVCMDMYGRSTLCGGSVLPIARLLNLPLAEVY